MKDTMAYKPRHIERWHETVNYEGANFDEYYVAYMRLFRSTPMERSNFLYIMQHLNDTGAEKGQVILPIFTDKVFLYRYYVMVHQDAERQLKMADMFAERVKRKGSLDPEQELQYNDAYIQSRWAGSKLNRRVEFCRESGVSIFCARHKYFPYDAKGSEELRDLLSEAS